MKAIAIFCMLALLSIPAFAETDDCVVTLTIESYATITVDPTATITVTGDPTGEHFTDLPIQWSWGSNWATNNISASISAGGGVGAWEHNFDPVGPVGPQVDTAGDEFSPSVTLTLADGNVGCTATILLTISH